MTTKNKDKIPFARSSQIKTRHGMRTEIICFDGGNEIKIIRGANDPYIATLFAGDFIPVLESNGKYELDMDAIAATTEDQKPQAKTQVEKLAETMGDCVRAMKTQLPDADDDLIQKYAVAIFIRVSKTK